MGNRPEDKRQKEVSMFVAPHHRIRYGKITVAVHIIAGLFCGVLYHWYPGLAVLLFVGFGLFEYWEAKQIGDRGYKDFHEGLVGLGGGAFTILLLRLLGVLT